MKKSITQAQKLILETAEQKDNYAAQFIDWGYNEGYDDYNDYHGDYYDAE